MICASAAEFHEAVGGHGALIGLDVGSKTIGTAFCDALWSFASPAQLIKRRKFAADKLLLKSLIESRVTKGVVIGNPLNMDGSGSPRAQASRAFAQNIGDFNLPILLWDERLSTAAAERDMIAADMSRAKRAERIDNAAATVILQGAIDALVNIT